jgi:hypothetical protein
MFRSVRNELLLGSSVLAILAAVGAASAQQAGQPSPTVVPPSATPIPQINVTAPPRTAARPARRPTGTTAAPTAPPTPEQVQMQANQEVVQRTQTLDQRRDGVIMTKAGTSNYELNAGDIQQIPQANAIQLSDLILQFPGVTQDSTSSGDFHIRNEHGNVQYRVNGILLPDGVSGFSQILESSFIGSMRLITGAMPAQYGLHTAGIIDITSKSGAALAGGLVGVYGGSRQTISPYFEYGGVEGNTEYYATGRYLSTGLGLESPTPTLNGIHDYSQQGRFFSYTSTLLDPSTRFVTIAGVGETRYQIPNNVGQTGNGGGLPLQEGATSRLSARTSTVSIQPTSIKGSTRGMPTQSPLGSDPLRMLMCNSRIITATAIFTSCPIRSATCFSTTSRPTSSEARSSTAFRVTARTASTMRTPFAPVSTPKASRPGSRT